MRKFLLTWLPLVLVILIGYGCSSLQNPINPSASPSPPQLTIEKIEVLGQPGTYTLRGKAALPDKTRLSVSAVRDFALPSVSQGAEPSASQYAILDREFAVVDQGAWQTKLTLWKTALDGRYQESWQMGMPAPPAGSSPDPKVTFLVTLEPATFAKAVDQKLEASLNKTQSPILSFTDSGTPYLQVSQKVAVALPTGRLTTRPSEELAENPWDGRSELNAAAADFGKQPTLPFDERDNLPLPKDNMLQ
ncbi:MAG TPA: hypothetical protein V6D29_20895 [Leptolyngbyaceae cyanobacterium]